MHGVVGSFSKEVYHSSKQLGVLLTVIMFQLVVFGVTRSQYLPSYFV